MSATPPNESNDTKDPMKNKSSSAEFKQHEKAWKQLLDCMNNVGLLQQDSMQEKCMTECMEELFNLQQDALEYLLNELETIEAWEDAERLLPLLGRMKPPKPPMTFSICLKNGAR